VEHLRGISANSFGFNSTIVQIIWLWFSVFFFILFYLDKDGFLWYLKMPLNYQVVMGMQMLMEYLNIVTTFQNLPPDVNGIYNYHRTRGRNYVYPVLSYVFY